MTLFVIKETFFESRRVRRIHQLQFKLQEGIRPGIMSDPGVAEKSMNLYSLSLFSVGHMIWQATATFDG